MTINIRPLQPADAERLLQLRLDNREYMRIYDPIRPDHYWTLETQYQLLQQGQQQWTEGTGYVFGIFLPDSNQLIGRLEITGVARGPFQNANIGYFIDQQYHGQGYGSEALRQSVHFAFTEAELHRVQAGVMTWNIPSQRILEKNGFRREGLAERYLKINGKWEDHLLYALTAEEWHI